MHPEVCRVKVNGHTFPQEYSPYNLHFPAMALQRDIVKRKNYMSYHKCRCAFSKTENSPTVAARGRRGRCGAAAQTRAWGRGVAAVNLHRTEPRAAPGWTANFGNPWEIRTALRWCCREEAPLDAACCLSSCSQPRCSPLTLTPVTPSGETESQGACSGSLWPCTGKSTLIKGCECCLYFSTVPGLRVRILAELVALIWEIKSQIISEIICLTSRME